jgi:uncharacterized protein YkwD
VGQGTARLAVAVAAAFLLTAAPASARPGPDIVSAHFDKPAVTGTTSTLVVKVRDALASINGVRVDFGDGSQLELSACRPASAYGPLPDVFKIGRPAAFSIEHVYEQAGQLTVHVVATSGDCAASRAISELDQKVRVLGAPKKLGTDTGPLGRLAADAELCANSTALPGSVAAPAIRASVLCLLGYLRQAFGLPQLTTNKRLANAAQRHASDMVARNFFAHTSPDGRDLTYRLRKARFKIRSITGENIGAGTDRYGTPLGVILSWYYSAQHRANMLERGFRRAGVGVASGMPFVSGDVPAATFDLTLAGR